MANRAYTQTDSPGAEPRAKCDVYDCLVILVLDWRPFEKTEASGADLPRLNGCLHAVCLLKLL